MIWVFSFTQGAIRQESLITAFENVLRNRVLETAPGYLEAMKEPGMDKEKLRYKFLAHYPLARGTEIDTAMKEAASGTSDKRSGS